jgi:divalent metal cation (Fe/Co/Zn/Cd) transporter
LHIEQHLEVDETMPLRQAHELVTELEAEMRREVPSIASILTHIESEPATIERPASLERDRELELRLRRVAAAFPEVLDIHEVYVTRHGPSVVPAAPHSASGDPSATGPQPATNNWQPATAFPERTQVSCHCTLPDDLPMARVHAVITALEGAFKLVAPEVDRLLIHPEPATDNRR